jgi:outer membrane murein-binding lipoprotein Lpp
MMPGVKLARGSAARVPWLFAVVLAGLCVVGCNTQAAYLSAQEMQRAQCDQLTDLQELQRCRANARQSYDDYQRQRDAVKAAE